MESTSKQRDPRQDPMPGDVLFYGPQWQQERAEVEYIRNNGDVWYLMNGVEFCAHRSQWWKMMEGAEVVHVA